MRKFLIKVIYSMFILYVSNISASEEDASIVVSGTGVIAKIVDGDSFWLYVTDRNYSKIQENLLSIAPRSSFIFKSKKLFNVQLMNIATESVLKKNKNFLTSTSPLVLSLKNEWKKVINKSEVFFECYGEDINHQVMCTIYYDKQDLSYYVIRKGYSSYITNNMKHPKFDSKYAAAQKIAQSEKIGIWKPYHQFLYPSEEL